MDCPACNEKIEKVIATGPAEVTIIAEVEAEISPSDLIPDNIERNYHRQRILKNFRKGDQLDVLDSNIQHANFELDAIGYSGSDVTHFYCPECQSEISRSEFDHWHKEVLAAELIVEDERAED